MFCRINCPGVDMAQPSYVKTLWTFHSASRSWDADLPELPLSLWNVAEGWMSPATLETAALFLWFFIFPNKSSFKLNECMCCLVAHKYPAVRLQWGDLFTMFFPKSHQLSSNYSASPLKPSRLLWDSSSMPLPPGCWWAQKFHNPSPWFSLTQVQPYLCHWCCVS